MQIVFYFENAQTDIYIWGKLITMNKNAGFFNIP